MSSLLSPVVPSSAPVLKALPSSVPNSSHIQAAALGQSRHEQWSPYTMNEGTVLALAGPDYCIVAGDTRMSEGYSILSRSVPKLCQLNGTSILATAGMQADACQLRKVLAIRLEEYKHRHNKEMSVTSIAQLLSNTLYFKRFFPYYTFNLLAGLDAEGKGAVFGYDAIGSFERMKYGVNGSGQTLITSVLDNQAAFKTHRGNAHDLTVEEAVDLVKDCFTVAGERDIYTGDEVDIAIMTKDGTKFEKFSLKKD